MPVCCITEAPTHTLSQQRKPVSRRLVPARVASHISPAMKLAGNFKDSRLPEPQSTISPLSFVRITQLQNDFMSSHKQTLTPINMKRRQRLLWKYALKGTTSFFLPFDCFDSATTLLDSCFQVLCCFPWPGYIYNSLR